jgi:hypothetical protein
LSLKLRYGLSLVSIVPPFRIGSDLHNDARRSKVRNDDIIHQKYVFVKRQMPGAMISIEPLLARQAKGLRVSVSPNRGYGAIPCSK